MRLSCLYLTVSGILIGAVLDLLDKVPALAEVRDEVVDRWAGDREGGVVPR
jgi:hypothetical protein